MLSRSMKTDGESSHVGPEASASGSKRAPGGEIISFSIIPSVRIEPAVGYVWPRSTFTSLALRYTIEFIPTNPWPPFRTFPPFQIFRSNAKYADGECLPLKATSCGRSYPTYRFLYQPIFVWESGTWGPVPRWLSPPDTTVIERLSRSHLQLPASCHLAMTFFSEGAFNKLYSIAVSDEDGNIGSPRYIFRATSPVEPFYKTASEAATLSYIREHTSVPVPRVIAYSSAENELGCEWILMEKVPGVALANVWSDIDLETKSRETRIIAGFVRQLQDIQRRFTAIGNLYFRKDIDTLNAAVRVVPTDDEKYVLGPIVTPYMFAGGRKLRVPRNLGPYPNDGEYISALIAAETEEMKLLLSEDAHSYADFDEDLAEDAEDIVEVLNELQTISTTLFPSRPRYFALRHHDLSPENILVDPGTYKVTGIVDWECVGTRPHWEDTYPLFLFGPEIEGEADRPAPGDRDEFRVERWENWEKMKLRPVFDRELGEARHQYDEEDEVRREFRKQLDWVEISQRKVKNWMKEYVEGRVQIQSDATE